MTTQTDQPVPPKPATPTPIPPVRQPITGSPARPGYPDASQSNALGAKPIGKAGA